MSFSNLGLAPELMQAIQDCGYTTPTPIQEKAIPWLLSGRDLMGCAQTGTGKTAAFALPILHKLVGSEPGRLRVLVLVPTRELAMQVGRNIAEYSRGLNLRSTAVYGGVPIEPQEMMLRHGVDLLVATPGRLKDHIWRGLIDFRDTRFLVLDEADRMLDMGFIDAVREIVDLIPTDRQTMLFSATLEPEITRLAKDILRDPVRVEVAPPATVADGIQHVVVPVQAGTKKKALSGLLRDREMQRTLIFTKTRRGAHQLAMHLGRQGHKVSSIHSDKTQSQRVAALAAFSGGRLDILVATDIAARGLDVSGISHVINYDVPRHAEDYVHRIGRTARAGHQGIAISLVTPEDHDSVRSIERLIGLSLADGKALRDGDGGRGNGARAGNGSNGHGGPAGNGARGNGHARSRSGNGRSADGRSANGRSASSRSGREGAGAGTSATPREAAGRVQDAAAVQTASAGTGTSRGLAVRGGEITGRGTAASDARTNDARPGDARPRDARTSDARPVDARPRTRPSSGSDRSRETQGRRRTARTSYERSEPEPRNGRARSSASSRRRRDRSGPEAPQKSKAPGALRRMFSRLGLVSER